MASDLGPRLLNLAGPLLDIPPPRPTPTVAQQTGVLDLASGGGVEIALVGTIAAVVAAVLAFIVRARRR